LHSHIEVGDRVVEPVLRAQANLTAIEVGIGTFRFQLDCLREIRLSLLKLPGDLVDLAAIAVVLRVFRLLLDRFRELGRRRVPLLAPGRCNALARVAAGISGRFRRSQPPAVR